ncbi:hypothetical protein EUX98_g7468 [Antrodiella citrinella]|uniref:Uncharacterized protein n=1 Tax=Antrodiella citrinella TaxID=2447956 RepID=A0A4S4MNU8_9APHY|nr:hypothetical protein EUX98_g7468 [Antrodiella citrinella]
MSVIKGMQTRLDQLGWRVQCAGDALQTRLAEMTTDKAPRERVALLYDKFRNGFSREWQNVEMLLGQITSASRGNGNVALPRALEVLRDVVHYEPNSGRFIAVEDFSTIDMRAVQGRLKFRDEFPPPSDKDWWDWDLYDIYKPSWWTDPEMNNGPKMRMIDDSVAMDLFHGSQSSTRIAFARIEVLERAITRVKDVIAANDAGDSDSDEEDSQGCSSQENM